MANWSELTRKQTPAKLSVADRLRIGAAVLFGSPRKNSIMPWLAGVLAGRRSIVDPKIEGGLDRTNPQTYIDATTSWAAIALDYSAHTMATPKIKIGIRKRGTTDDPKPYEPKGMLTSPQKLLDQPIGGEARDQASLRMWADQSAHMFGRALFELVRESGDSGETESAIVGLRILPYIRVRIETINTEVRAYWFQEGATARRIDPRNVWVIKNGINPGAPGWGISTFDKAKDALDLRKFIADAENAFFLNGCSDGGILTIPGTEADWANSGLSIAADGSESLKEPRLRTMYNEILSQKTGVTRSGMPFIVTSDMKWERNTTSKDINFLEGRKAARQEIFAAWGISERLVGVDDGGSDTHTSLQMRINYQRSVLAPRLKYQLDQFAGYFNEAFPLDPAYEWAIIAENVIDIDFETELKLFQAEAGGLGTAFTIRTPRMAMLRAGYTETDIAKIKDPKGRLDALFVREGFHTLDEEPRPVTPPGGLFGGIGGATDASPAADAAKPNAAPTVKRLAGPTPQRLAAAENLRRLNLKTKFQKINRTAANEFRLAVAPLAIERGQRLVSIFTEQGIEGAEHFLRSTRREFLKNASQAALDPRLNGWTRIAEATAEAFASKVEFKKLGGAGDPISISLDWLTDLLLGSTSELLDGWDAVTQDEIRDLVHEVAADGGGRAEQAAALNEFWDGQIEEWRLRRDVESESNAAQADASLLIARGTGISFRKHWLAAHDSRTRETHRQADEDYGTNAEGIPDREKFQVGDSQMDKPGDKAAEYKEIVWCRCVPTYSLPN